MKKVFLTTSVLAAVAIFCISSCTQKDIEKEEFSKIENTLKSVSLWQDSLKVDPTKLLASLERINKAIDSIGYPDAGYQLWIVQSDTATGTRFMLNGNWPNQVVYNEIHDHELYKNANELEDELWSTLSATWYNRFMRVK